MTTKEQYTLYHEWVDIPLKVFKEMYDAGFTVEYAYPSEGGWHWVRAPRSADEYDESFAPFRTKRSEYMRYLNRPRPAQNDSLADSLRKAGERAKVDCSAAQRSDVKSRPDLLPSKAVLAAGRVLAFGLSKHPDEKWKTLSVEDHVAACARHLFTYLGGEKQDEESAESHLTHALCRIAFAIARDTE